MKEDFRRDEVHRLWYKWIKALNAGDEVEAERHKFRASLLIEGVCFREYVPPDVVDAEIAAPSRRRSIERPAGHTFSCILSTVYSKKTFERVFRQHILDMREEQNEAIQAGQRWKERWIVVRGNLTVISMILAHAPTSLIKYVVKIWKLGH